MTQAKIFPVLLYTVASVAALGAGAVIALILIWLMATGGNYSVEGDGWMACGNVFDNINPFLISLIKWSIGSVLTLVLAIVLRRYAARRLGKTVLK